MKRALLFLAILLAAVGAFVLTRQKTPPSELERNRAFAQSMSNVVLKGIDLVLQILISIDTLAYPISIFFALKTILFRTSQVTPCQE